MDKKDNMDKVNFSGNVFQNDINIENGEYDLESGQMYFEMETNYRFLLGIKDLLVCLKFAEQQGELPPIGLDKISGLPIICISAI